MSEKEDAKMRFKKVTVTYKGIIRKEIRADSKLETRDWWEGGRRDKNTSRGRSWARAHMPRPGPLAALPFYARAHAISCRPGSGSGGETGRV